MNAEIDRILPIFEHVFQVIAEAFEARVVRVGADGKPIDLGPDHYARLAAAGSLIKILTAGRPTPRVVDPKRERWTMTLTEVEAEPGW